MTGDFSVALIAFTPHMLCCNLLISGRPACLATLSVQPCEGMRPLAVDAAASHCRWAASIREVMSIGSRSQAEGAGAAKLGAPAARLEVASVYAQNLTLRATGAHGVGGGGGAGGLAVRHLLTLRQGRDVRMAAIRASGDITVWRRDGAVADWLLHAWGPHALLCRAHA